MMSNVLEETREQREKRQADSRGTKRLEEQEHRHCVRFITKRFHKRDQNFGVDVNIPDETVAAITTILRSVSKSILTEALCIDERESTKRQRPKKRTITKSIADEAIETLGLSHFGNAPTATRESVEVGLPRQIHTSFLEKC